MASSTIPWKDIKVLSFDIYGTLIDWETGIYQNLLASALGPSLPPSRQQVLEQFEDLERSIQRANPGLRQSAVNAEAVRQYARQLGCKLGEREIEQAAVAFGESLGTWPAFPDTVAAVQKLQQRYKLVPLSNIDRASFAGSLAGPLKGCRFDAVYTAEDIGSYKPDARNFEYLLEHVRSDFGVGKEGLCHVAQSLFHDHAPAKGFGITSVWVARKGVMGARAEGEKLAAAEEQYGFQLKVDTLGELAEIVDRATE